MTRSAGISLACAAVASAAAATAVLAGPGRTAAPEAQPDDRATAVALAELATEVGRLRDRLEIESQQRMLLARELAGLSRTLLDASAPSVGTASASGRSSAEPTREAPSGTESAPAAEPAFDEERLVAAGFSRAEVRAFRARFDELSLEQLYRSDRALREGPRAAMDRGAGGAPVDMAATLRGEFGDELYDWALYTTGHDNRVRIADVMVGSPAAEQELQAGDVILRYGDEPIFGLQDLRRSTSLGEPGEPTWVEIDRGGERRRVLLPRGPLGVRIESARAEPTPLR